MKQRKLLTTRFISILSAGFRQISWEMLRRQIPSPARPGKQDSFSEWSGAVQKGLNLIYGGREFDNGARRTGGLCAQLERKCEACMLFEPKPEIFSKKFIFLHAWDLSGSYVVMPVDSSDSHDTQACMTVKLGFMRRIFNNAATATA